MQESESPLALKARQFILERLKERVKMVGGETMAADDLAAGNQSLVDSGLYDSLSFLDLLAMLESEFDTEIDLSEYDPEYFVTLNGLAAIVAESLNGLQKEKTDSASLPEGTEQESAEIIYEEITPQHALWNDLAEFFAMLYTHMGKLSMHLQLKENGPELWLKSIEKTVGKTNYVIGAIDNGKLVGYLHGSLKILPVYYEGGYAGIMASMFVLPEYRKHGIARELGKRMHEWFRMRGAHSLEAQILINNEASLSLFQNFGYEKELVQLRKVLE